MPTFKSIGYGFDVTLVAPGDLAGAKAKLDAAKAAGIRLIIGLYGFGGPEPYSYSNGQWTITQPAQDVLNYLESRESEIIAFFGFNEPYWVMGLGAAELRALRTKIRSVWPNAKIYHDIGHPSRWAPGGDLAQGDKWADQTGVADYVGIWEYPFHASGYTKEQALAVATRESNFVVNSMGAIPVWLAQSYANDAEALIMPTSAQIKDWNCSLRATLPPQALISWYAWRQSLYSDFLANNPSQWPLTTQAACQA